MMAAKGVTRDFFLWCMAAIYLFAFSSLFVQIPGLYGDNGILPARFVLEKKCKDEHPKCAEWAKEGECKANPDYMLEQCAKSCRVCDKSKTGYEAESFEDLLKDSKPTFLRILPKLGLNIETGMDFLCGGGIILAFVAMVSASQRNTITFAFLWAFYFSLYQVGQTFMWFQWDILLLEAGFLCIIVAPLNLFGWAGRVWYHRHDAISLWLIKWLLFRLMFASGVVKLTSQCPTWWGLTALNYHYETQCISTPLAWFAHQLPEWLQKLSVSAVYVIEMALPFLFFSPVRKQRLFAAYAQVFLMVVIQLTGNYNFFNLLTCALCVAVLDDVNLLGCMGKKMLDSREDAERLPVIGKLWRPIKWSLNILVFGGLVYWTVKLFNLRLSLYPFKVDSKIMFKSSDLDKFLVTIVPITIWIGAISLCWEIGKALISSVLCEKGILRKMYSVICCLLIGSVAVAMFGISLVDHTVIERNTQSNLSPVIKQWYRNSEPYQLTSAYGLFRRMTGVGGRPEVIIEGSDNQKGPWKEYNFLYKPGNVSEAPPFVAPHQPRLDWQMWFAALGSYQNNPWFLNFVYRLFHNQQQVLELMAENPFKERPPKYIRATLYHYHFTSLNTSASGSAEGAWWTRKKVSEYLPIISPTDASFVKYITEAGLVNDSSPPKKTDQSKPSFLQHVMISVRQYVGQPNGFLTCMSLFFTAVVLSFLDPTLRYLRHGTS